MSLSQEISGEILKQGGHCSCPLSGFGTSRSRVLTAT
jgi:hypothetical protein